MAHLKIYGSPINKTTVPRGWRPLPVSTRTKESIMERFAHCTNFSYDQQAGFLVEVPNGTGRSKVGRATVPVLKNHVEVSIRLTRGGNFSSHQPPRPPDEVYSWWLGQLIHYGLPLELSADEAKDAVKGEMLRGTLRVPNHLQQRERRMKNNANRKAKKRALRLTTRRSPPKKCAKMVKVESGSSDVENDSDIILNPAVQRPSQPRLKVAVVNSSESDSDEANSSDDEASQLDGSGIIKAVPALRAVMSEVQKKRTASVGLVRTANVEENIPNAGPEDSPVDSSSESESESDAEDIEHDPLIVRKSADGEAFSNYSSFESNEETEYIDRDASSFHHEQEISETDSNSDRFEAIRKTATKTILVSDDSNEEIQDSRLSSINPECGRAVNPNANFMYSAEEIYVNTATFGTRSDIEVRPATKLLGIRHDVRPQLGELEQLSEKEPTPPSIPGRYLKHRSEVNSKVPTNVLKKLKRTVSAEQQRLSLKDHPKIELDDIADPRFRLNLHAMSETFPRESVYSCYICLTKAHGNYLKACDKMTDILSSTKTKTLKKPARYIPATAQKEKFPPGSRQDPLILSDSDEPTQALRIEPKLIQRKTSRLSKRDTLISDESHGFQIDLTSAAEDESLGRAKSIDFFDLTSTREIAKEPSPPEKPAKKMFRAVAVEIQPSASKSYFKKKEKQQNTFPSSPPVPTGPKSIVKFTSSSIPPDSLLNETLNSMAPPSRQASITASSDLSPRPPKRKRSPELPPLPPARKPKHGLASLYGQSANYPVKKTKRKAHVENNVSCGAFMTNAGSHAHGDQLLMQNAQAAKISQPESRRTSFPEPEYDRSGCLSRPFARSMLQRPVVGHSVSRKVIPTPKKRRTPGF